MSDSGNDTFSRVMAIFAIVIAVASLACPIWSDQKSEMEDLIIDISRVHSDYKTEIIASPAIQYLPAVLPVYYKCVLVNNGKVPISIVDYDLQQIAEGYPITYYSYMDGGLFDSSGKPLQLPLDIDSKKSYRFFVKVGVAVHPKAYELISKNFTSQKKISIEELISYLARNRVDFYGNTVDPQIDHGNLLGFSVPMKNRREQIFFINFKTSRGNYFGDTAFWYKEVHF
ncbi:MAG: hypothetical protein C5S49_01630 [Candidatus Methanogaster sp.]|nr:MAG: hypothetical protein C5S49_01630 [ANME-2 cluster archaeon]